MLKKLAILGGIAALSALASAERAKYIEIPGVQEFTGQMIVRPKQIDHYLSNGWSREAAEQLKAMASQQVASLEVDYLPQTDMIVTTIPEGFDENSFANHLMKTGLYEYVEPNYRHFPALTPNDPLYGSQWHHPKINSPLAWDIFTGNNSSVIVAICDTGVRKTHEDMVGRFVSGYNSASNQTEANGGQVNDIHGHGTHVAGIVAATGNNGKGVAGMAWGVKIMPIRVSNSSNGGSNISWMVAAINWAADNGAHILNFSYSGVQDNAFQTAGAYAKSKGCLVHFAHGNSSAQNNNSHADVTIVGSVNSNDQLSWFSNYGAAQDCVAPGENIWSCSNSGDTSYQGTGWDGTSFASPIAAGISALIKGRNFSLTPNQVENILLSTCKDLGAAGKDNIFGWGRVDAQKALQNTPAPYEVNPSSYNVGPQGQEIGANNVSKIVNDDGTRAEAQNTAVANTNIPAIRFNVFFTSPITSGIAKLTLTVDAQTQFNNIEQRLEFVSRANNNNTYQKDLYVFTSANTDVTRSGTTTNAAEIADIVNPSTGALECRVRYRKVGVLPQALFRGRPDYIHLTVN